jgi:S1-C subfamily serine protease
LIITNAHVVGEAEDVSLFFPYFKHGKPLVDPVYYAKNVKPIRGKVRATDKQRDLALIEAPDLPPGYRALPLADRSAKPNETVHIAGNSAADEGTLWLYRTTEVKTPVYFDVVGDVRARLVQTPLVIDHGDSGSPFVNDDGQVVAVAALGRTEESIAMSIDVAEVRIFIDRALKRSSVMPASPIVGSWTMTATVGGETFVAYTVFETDGTCTFNGRRIATGRYRTQEGRFSLTFESSELVSDVKLEWEDSDRFEIRTAEIHAVFERM